ncbi:MAG TPA: class I SAM-dependent methyltransferase [Steroidobacteraceae bacterium]|nr:class I SAM-dependent methyltransferase [Steroidobacteraceae bacterium]
MQKDRPSYTALRVAMGRAAHQLFDKPLLLEDPLALHVIGPQSAQEIRTHRDRFDDRYARHLRAFVVARSRLAEDMLHEALQRGVRQYVVLGAGLDTFAYRNPYPELRVFEVDHPTTQAWKRRQLVSSDIALPESLTFVPIDFETERLGERLRASGFADDAPSFLSWLGTTMYLTPDAVLGTLRFVTKLPAGTSIVFDYAVSPWTLSFVRRMVVRGILQRVAAIGEPWKTFFDPQSFTDELRSLGFAHIEDLGGDELNARFFRANAGLRVSGLGRIVYARV